jgi:hypothetical protein
MGTIWLRDIKAGLDARKMPETLGGGAALVASSGPRSSKCTICPLA